MGSYLTTPVTTKNSEHGGDKQTCSYFGLSSMQGWRHTMEDAHIAVPSLKNNTMAIYGVFDGHGGGSVAQWISENFTDEFNKMFEKCKVNKANIHIPDDSNGLPHDSILYLYAAALELTFFSLDEQMKTPQITKEIRLIYDREHNPDGKTKTDMDLYEEEYYENLKNAQFNLRNYINKKYDIADPNDRDKPKENVTREELDDFLTGYKENRADIFISDDMLLKDTEAESHIDDASNYSEENNSISEPTISNPTENGLNNIDNDNTLYSPLDNGFVNGNHGEKLEELNQSDQQNQLNPLNNLNQLDNLDTLNNSAQQDNLDNSSQQDNLSIQQNSVQQDNLDLENISDPLDKSDLSDKSDLPGISYSLDTSNALNKSDFMNDEDLPDDVEILDDVEHLNNSVQENSDNEETESGSTKSNGEYDFISYIFGKYLEYDHNDENYDGDEDTDDDQYEDDYFSGVSSHPRAVYNYISTFKKDEIQDICGTTAIVVILLAEPLPVYIIGNAGDSRAVLSRAGQAVPLSFDHKPSSPVELNRIKKAGGTVISGRVDGNLNLSRSLGDLNYKNNKDLKPQYQKITSLPDVIICGIHKDDDFIVIACDGIWDCKSGQEVVNFVRERISDHSTPEELSKISEELCDSCLSKSPDSNEGVGCDNMTCLITKPSTFLLDNASVNPPLIHYNFLKYPENE